MTGGRLARVLKYVQGDAFCLTYGQGVSNVDITAPIAFHRAHGKLPTVTAVYPPRRFGALDIVETASADSMKSSRTRVALSARGRVVTKGGPIPGKR
jgi:NDP-sugar pyrophosphorylase family protein